MKTRPILLLGWLVPLAILTAPLEAQAPAGPAGHWVGTIEVPSKPLEIEVDLAPAADGKWQGTITIPAQNLKAFPLGDVAVAGSVVSFAMKGVPGEPQFKGTFTQETRSLSGDFSQGGGSVPFKLAWKGEAKIEPVAKSTAIGKELEGSWEGAIEADATKLRLVVKLSNQSGIGTGTLVSVDQGGVELPVDSIIQSGSRLTFQVRSVMGAYEGGLKDGQIVGTWTQGPRSVPLTLKPAAK